MGNTCCVAPEEVISTSSSPHRPSTSYTYNVERIKEELKEEWMEQVKEELKHDLKEMMKEEIKAELMNEQQQQLLMQQLKDWIKNEIDYNSGMQHHQHCVEKNYDHDDNDNDTLKVVSSSSSSSCDDDDDDDHDCCSHLNSEGGGGKEEEILTKEEEEEYSASVQKYKEVLEELASLSLSSDNKNDPKTSYQNWEKVLLSAVRRKDLCAVKVLLLEEFHTWKEELIVEYDSSCSSSSSSNNDDPRISIVDEAVNMKDTEIAKVLSKFGISSHMFVQYAREGNVEKMKILLTKYGINPNSTHKGSSALRAAVRGGHQVAVELLIEHEASTTTTIAASHTNNIETTTQTPILLEALEYGHIDIAQYLVDSGIQSLDMSLAKWVTSCGGDGIGKWAGVAACNNKLFFCPCDASHVLVFDIDKGEVRTIDVGGINNAYSKWVGIASYGNKLFCAPHNAENVLVINGKTERIHTISLDSVAADNVAKKKRRGKWNGIIRCGKKLYCAPCNSSFLLTIDGDTERLRTIPCGEIEEEERERKWVDIAKYGNKLFCCPANASSIMVINTESNNDNVYHIPLGSAIKNEDGDDNNNKWGGIVCYDTKLFCTPCNSSSILIIDGDTERMRTIPCGVRGNWKWSGIERFDTKLVSSPFHASSIMIIDGETEEITYRPACDENENLSGKWHGIVQFGEGSNKKLVCSPFNSNDILILEDYRNLLSI